MFFLVFDVVIFVDLTFSRLRETLMKNWTKHNINYLIVSKAKQFLNNLKNLKAIRFITN